MLKILQDTILLLSGYLLILILLGGYFFITNFRRWNEEEDSTTIAINEWKEIQVRNHELKKEKETLLIESLRIERANKDIIEEIKYQNQ